MKNVGFFYVLDTCIYYKKLYFKNVKPVLVTKCFTPFKYGGSLLVIIISSVYTALKIRHNYYYIATQRYRPLKNKIWFW